MNSVKFEMYERVFRLRNVIFIILPSCCFFLTMNMKFCFSFFLYFFQVSSDGDPDMQRSPENLLFVLFYNLEQCLKMYKISWK